MMSEAVRVVAPTEERNPRTAHIDEVSVLDALQLINSEDYALPGVVAAVLPDIARAVELGVDALRSDGRIHYAGAGASGRIAAVDAAELVPTYAIEPDRFVAHLAGGPSAMVRAFEGVEDDEQAGWHALASTVATTDLVVGLTASGRTPFVAGALRAAAEAGASTALVSANPSAVLARLVDVHVGLDTGPEVIAGSTRMKAATAQKMALNAFSTTVMVQLGRTYSNLMVDVIALNGKLRGRVVRLLEQATGLPENACTEALDRAGGELKVALVALLGGADVSTSRAALEAGGGVVRAALAQLSRDGHDTRSEIEEGDR